MQGMTLRKYIYVLSLTKPSPYTITVITLKKNMFYTSKAEFTEVDSVELLLY